MRRDLRPPAVGWIIAAACARYHCTLAEVRSDRRHPDIVAARRQIAALLREWRGMSWPEIAEVFGHRNHSTAMTAARDFWDELHKSIGN